MRRPRSSYIAVVLVATAIAIAFFVSKRFVITRRSSPIERLVTTARTLPRRPFEARVVGFPYAPLAIQRGVATVSDPPEFVPLRDVARDILNHKDESGNAENLYVRGVSNLTAGDLRMAISLLEAATTQLPQQSRYWATLAAARFEAGKQQNDLRMLASALGASTRALDLEPSLPEARFNQAITLEALRLRAAAAESFRRYLMLDASSQWAAEARNRLVRCEQRTKVDEWKTESVALEHAATSGDNAAVAHIVADFSQESRVAAEALYPLRWSQAELAGQPSEATNWLAAAHAVAKAVRAHSGESLPLDAIQAIERSHDPHALARAYVTYGTARMTYSKREITGALSQLRQAEKMFRDAQSPMALVAEYYRANALHDANQTAAALAEAERLLEILPAQYRTLRAQTLWLKGTIFANSGRPSESLAAYEESRRDLLDLRERQDAALLTTYIPNVLTILGRPEEAWKLRSAAFEAASDLGNTGIMETVLGEAARNEVRNEQWEVAHSFFELMLAANPTPNPRRRVDAQVWMALADWRMHHDGRAAQAINVARASAEALKDHTLRDAAISDVGIAEAAIVTESEPQRAILLLDNAVAFMTETGRQNNLPQVYLQRARACERLTRNDEAIADLSRAVNAVEARGATVQGADLREAFIGTATAIYDELIGLLAQRGDWEAAFLAAERSRARSIAERLAIRGSVDVVANWQQLLAAIPGDAALLQFTALPARLVTIVADRSGLRGSVIDVPNKDLAALITDWNVAIAHQRTPDILRLGVRLRHILLVALGPVLPPRLVIITDTTTAALPFAALPDAVTNRFLIDDSELTIAPSATVALRGGTSAPSRRPHVAVFGDPSFDMQQHPGMPRLDDAAAEAAEIGKLYGVTAHIGSDATASSFLSAIETSDVLHVGAHVVANEYRPSTSALLFAPDGRGRGEVTIAQIAATRAHPGALAVLAGCGTATASSTGTSISTFATAFLASGYRWVVGTLWNVDDSSSRVMSVRLHELLRGGAAPASALRQVQLGMLRSPEPQLRAARAWSAFQIFGAVKQ
jgi:tetratricopeptide (TPR) repeat protein